MSKNTGGSGKDIGKGNRSLAKYKVAVDHEDDEDDLLEQAMMKTLLGKVRSPPGKTQGGRPIHTATGKTNALPADTDHTEGRRRDGGGGGGAINPDLALAVMLGNVMNMLITAKQRTSPPNEASDRARRIHDRFGGSNRDSSRSRSSSTGSRSSATVSVSSGQRPESGTSSVAVRTTEQQCDQISEAIRSSGQRIALKLEEMHREFHQQENQATERTVAELARIRLQFTEQIEKLMQSARGTTNGDGSPSSSTKASTGGNQKSSQ